MTCGLLSAGPARHTDRITATEESVRWGSADLDLRLPGRRFVSGSFERDGGGFGDVKLAYASQSWRF